MGCRTRRPQQELLRVVRRSDGTLEVGRTLPGRGAWVCPSSAPSGENRCVDLAERRKAFGRAFKAELADGAIEALRARMVERTTSS